MSSASDWRSTSVTRLISPLKWMDCRLPKFRRRISPAPRATSSANSIHPRFPIAFPFPAAWHQAPGHYSMEIAPATQELHGSPEWPEEGASDEISTPRRPARPSSVDAGVLRPEASADLAARRQHHLPALRPGISRARETGPVGKREIAGAHPRRLSRPSDLRRRLRSLRTSLGDRRTQGEGNPRRAKGASPGHFRRVLLPRDDVQHPPPGRKHGTRGGRRSDRYFPTA